MTLSIELQFFICIRVRLNLSKLFDHDVIGNKL